MNELAKTNQWDDLGLLPREDAKTGKRMNSHTFNLYDRSFIKFVVDRSGDRIDDGPADQVAHRLNFYQNWTHDDIMTRPDFVYFNGEPVSEPDRVSWCAILDVARKKFQTLWQLYTEIQEVACEYCSH